MSDSDRAPCAAARPARRDPLKRPRTSTVGATVDPRRDGRAQPRVRQQSRRDLLVDRLPGVSDNTSSSYLSTSPSLEQCPNRQADARARSMSASATPRSTRLAIRMRLSGSLGRVEPEGRPRRGIRRRRTPLSRPTRRPHRTTVSRAAKRGSRRSRHGPDTRAESPAENRRRRGSAARLVAGRLRMRSISRATR